nr:hypothetical protein GCM10020063_038370 [Dactylosporangium thailandense]
MTDVCGIRSSGSMFGGSWVECQRVVTAYLGTADIPDKAGWDQGLQQAGWFASGGQSQPPLYYTKNATIQIDWMRQPATPGPMQGAGALTVRYSNPAYREQKSVDVATFFPRYQYVVMVTVNDDYYPVRAIPSSPPPQNDHACYTGSGRCIGG